MSFRLRRVVTGHDENGRAMVSMDGMLDDPRSNRDGLEMLGVWATSSSPAEMDIGLDGREIEPGPPGSSASKFRVGCYHPGVTPRMHRTESLDYVIVMKGSIGMELDDGVVVRLEEGDVCVQRGTIHNWINSGTEPCVLAFVLLAAEPVRIGGREIGKTG